MPVSLTASSAHGHPISDTVYAPDEHSRNLTARRLNVTTGPRQEWEGITTSFLREA